MASKSVTIVIDDLTGKELASGASETVLFSLDGIRYELDVSTSGAAKLRAALAPYIKAGRKLASQRSGRRSKSGDAAAIRAWAAENGIEVSTRGRIPAAVIAQYEASPH